MSDRTDDNATDEPATPAARLEKTFAQMSDDGFKQAQEVFQREAERRDDPFKRVGAMTPYEFEMFKAKHCR